MPGLRVVEHGADRLAVRTAFAWELYAFAATFAALAAWCLAGLPGARGDDRDVLLWFAAVLGAAALAVLYPAVVASVSGVVLDRRTGDLRTVAVRRGRRIVTRRPMHLLRRVEVRPNGVERTYALAFEVRGEPDILFPPRLDGQDQAGGEAIAARVRAFLQGEGANRRA